MLHVVTLMIDDFKNTIVSDEIYNILQKYNWKKLLKSKDIGEDEEKSFEKNVQNITDSHIKTVDDKVATKEKEIMTI